MLSLTKLVANSTIVKTVSDLRQLFNIIKLKTESCVLLFSTQGAVLRTMSNPFNQRYANYQKMPLINPQQQLVVRYIPDISKMGYVDVYDNAEVWIELDPSTSTNVFDYDLPFKTESMIINLETQKFSLKQDDVDYFGMIRTLDSHTSFYAMDSPATNIKKYQFFNDQKPYIKGHIEIVSSGMYHFFYVSRLALDKAKWESETDVLQTFVHDIINKNHRKYPSGAELLLSDTINTRDVIYRLKHIDPDLFTIGFSKTNCHPVFLTKKDKMNEQVKQHIREFGTVKIRDNEYACRRGSHPYPGLRRYTDLFRVLNPKTNESSEFMNETLAREKSANEPGSVVVGPDAERSKWFWPCCFIHNQANKNKAKHVIGPTIYELQLLKKLDPQRVGRLPNDTVFPDTFRRVGTQTGTLIECVNLALETAIKLNDLNVSDRSLNNGLLFNEKQKDTAWALSHALAIKTQTNIFVFNGNSLMVPFIVMPDKPNVFVYEINGWCELIVDGQKRVFTDNYGIHAQAIPAMQNEADQWLSEIHVDPHSVTKIVIDAETNQVWYMFIDALGVWIPSMIDLPWPSNHDIQVLESFVPNTIDDLVSKTKRLSMNVVYGLVDKDGYVSGAQFDNGLQIPVVSVQKDSVAIKIPFQTKPIITMDTKNEQPRFKKLVKERIETMYDNLNNARVVVAKHMNRAKIRKIYRDRIISVGDKRGLVVKHVSKILRDLNMYDKFIAYQVSAELLWMGETSDIFKNSVIVLHRPTDNSMIMYL